MDWTESHEGQHLHPSQSLPVRPTDLRNRRNLARGVLLVDSESSSPVQGQARRRHSFGEFLFRGWLKLLKRRGLLREIGQKCLKRRRMRCRRLTMYSTDPKQPQGDLWVTNGQD